MSDSISKLFSLEGRTAVITGATRGIGEEMAIAIAEAGANVILVQVRNDAPLFLSLFSGEELSSQGDISHREMRRIRQRKAR